MLENDPRLKDIVNRILAVDWPEKIVLFGSRARKDNGQRSDFDLAVFGKVNLAKIMANLEEAETLLHIDIVAFDELYDEKFKQRILNEGVTLYERKI